MGGTLAAGLTDGWSVGVRQLTRPPRAASGQGVAAAFVVVALAFLGLFMLGWRLVRTRLAARH